MWRNPQGLPYLDGTIGLVWHERVRDYESLFNTYVHNFSVRVLLNSYIKETGREKFELLLKSAEIQSKAMPLPGDFSRQMRGYAAHVSADACESKFTLSLTFPKHLPLI